MTDLLSQATLALRTTGGDDGDRATATRLRLRRSLDTRARTRRQLASLTAAIAILFGATVSWAVATGRARWVWSTLSGRSSAPLMLPMPPQPRAATVEPRYTAAREPVVAMPAPTLPPIEPPAPPPRRPRVHALPPPPPPAPAVGDVLYRHAHELHFRGSDPAIAIAAWDAYLDAEPTGRFAVEARYNRALLWIRVGRYHDARTALEPFARGDVIPAGYRQDEAAKLIARLANLD